MTALSKILAEHQVEHDGQRMEGQRVMQVKWVGRARQAAEVGGQDPGMAGDRLGKVSVLLTEKRGLGQPALQLPRLAFGRQQAVAH